MYIKNNSINHDNILRRSKIYIISRSLSIFLSIIILVLLCALAYHYYNFQLENNSYTDLENKYDKAISEKMQVSLKYDSTNAQLSQITSDYKKSEQKYDELYSKYHELLDLYQQTLAENESYTNQLADDSDKTVYFTLGSSEDEVKKSMSIPDRITSEMDYDTQGVYITTWHYGTSTVTFNKSGFVIRWSKGNTPLNLN